MLKISMQGLDLDAENVFNGGQQGPDIDTAGDGEHRGLEETTRDYTFTYRFVSNTEAQ